MGHTDGTQTEKQAMAQNHLLRRGNRYFFRRRVPTELWEIIGKKEIKTALGTCDRKEAGRLATIETAKSDALFLSKRQTVQQVSPKESRRGVGYREAFSLVAQWYEELEQKSEDWFEANLELFRDPDRLKATLETCYLDEHFFSGGGDLGPGQTYHAEKEKRKLVDFLENNGLEFVGSNLELQRLTALVRKGYLENVRNDIKRLNHEPLNDRDKNSCFSPRENSYPVQFPSTPHEPQKSSFSATVGDVLKDFMEELESKGRSGSTLRTYTVPVRLLRETLGADTLLASIDRDRMKELRGLILALPSNATKHYPNKTLLQSIELAKRDGRPPIVGKTADGYLRNIQTIFNYATKVRKIPFNPIADELFRGNSRSRVKPRAQFSIEQLNSLFRSDQYRRSKPGRFWVPLLGLFQGTRSNETCQLYTEDALEIGGIWCLRIDDSRLDGSACEKNLKTAPSRRTIPIHPQILKMGFADFVRSRRLDKKSPRLFPDLNLGLKGYYSDPFQKWFGRRLVSVLGHKPTATFHSFRHMWKDALTEALVPDPIAKRLGGWSSDSSAFSQYGQGPMVKTLLESLQKVTFPGLNLDHLAQ